MDSTEIWKFFNRFTLNGLSGVSEAEEEMEVKIYPNPSKGMVNVNLNGYYFAAHRQYDGTDATSTSEVGDIKGKFLVNVKANWNVTQQLSLYVNARNVLNSNTREFFGTDRIGGLYTVGASFSLH